MKKVFDKLNGIAYFLTRNRNTTMTTETANNTAIKYKIGQFVKPVGFSKSATIGKIKSLVPPIGTSGEWSYYINWKQIGGGSGWRDCDIQLLK